MTGLPAPRGSTSTLPPPSVNGSAPPPASAPPRGRMHTRISGMRTALIAGALLMAAAGTARITQLRQLIRRDRRKPPAS